MYIIPYPRGIQLTNTFFQAFKHTSRAYLVDGVAQLSHTQMYCIFFHSLTTSGIKADHFGFCLLRFCCHLNTKRCKQCLFLGVRIHNPSSHYLFPETMFTPFIRATLYRLKIFPVNMIFMTFFNQDIVLERAAAFINFTCEHHKYVIHRNCMFGVVACCKF